MTTRFEVYIKENLVDPTGDGLLKDIEDLNIKGATSARFIRITTLEGNITEKAATKIAQKLLTDPVSQEYVIGSLTGDIIKNAWLVEVSFNPGVTDPVAESTLKGVADLGIKGVTSARTSTGVILRGDLSQDDVDTICRRLLANNVIQSFTIEKNN